MRIAVLGTGRVGRALATGLHAAGHHVTLGSRSPAGVTGQTTIPVAGHEDAVAEAETVVLAVPFGAAIAVLRELGDLGGRIVVDATNPIGVDTGGRSGAELLAGGATNARLVKAFNTIGAEHMGDARFPGGRAYALLAGDDADARSAIAELAEQLGFEPVHLGDLSTAQHAEAAAALWVHLALTRGYGRDFGIGLLRR
jgi:predicted dinucleotide-binding enzyme